MKRIILIIFAVAFFALLKTNVTNAQTSCTVSPPANTGKVTLSTTTTAGTYRVWARMKAGNVVTNDSFYIQIDNNCPILVGNTSQISSTTWTWVDFQNGSTTNKINVNLSAGNHVITLIGNEPNVAVDKILMTQVLSCVPTGLGENCPAETTATATPTPTPSISPTSTPTPTPQPGTISAFIESGGSVVMEGENNDAHIRRASYRWDGACCDTGGSNTSLTGFAGSGFIETRPNDDLKTFFESAYNQGPEVVYNINFTTTGTYYVYLRSSGPDAKSDSAHIGLDGKFAGAMALYFIGEGGATSNWKWKSNNNDGTRTKISVTTPGIHTFHIFMREDGVKVDRIRLFTNPDWVANPNDSAQGPAESPRGTSPVTTPTPIVTVTPTNTPTPTPIEVQHTALQFPIVKLHGIGTAGDNVFPNTSGNTNPVTKTKLLTVEFYDINDNLVGSVQGNVNYSTTNGYFSGIIDQVPVGTGNYIVKVKTHKYLKSRLLGIINIVANTTNQMPEVRLTAGDVNSDGVLSVLDYNILRGCFSDLLPPKDCDQERQFNSDITDDGIVDQDDSSLLLRETSVQLGD